MLKVGDKIKITKIKQNIEEFNYSGIFEGEIYEVENIDEMGFWFDFNGVTCYMEDDEDFEYEIIKDNNVLKTGDKVISLADLTFLGNVVISKGTIGTIKEKAQRCFLVAWQEGIKNDFGKTEWWIDSEDIKLIGDNDMYNIEKEKQFLINKGYNVDKHIEQAKEFYKEDFKDIEYEIDVDDVIFIRGEKETVIGNIDCLSNEWLKEILVNVLEQRNDLQDEINDLKDEIKELREEREDILNFMKGRDL